MTSLDKIQEQLDALVAAKEDTVRFRELLLGAVLEIQNEQNIYAAKLSDKLDRMFRNIHDRIELYSGFPEALRLVNTRLDEHSTRLAAIMGKLCAQQEARRGKAVRGDRNKKFGRG